VLDDLCRGLAVQGHDVLLYTTGDSTCPVERAWTFDRAIGTDRASVPAELHHVVDGYAAAREWGAEVVHDHTLSGPLFADRHPDLSIVTTNHGPFDGDLAAVYRALAEQVPIIAISHHQASTAEDTPIAAVIHHGLDLAGVPVGDGAGGHALFLGRMSPDKGVDIAARVARAAGTRLLIAAKLCEPAEYDYFNARVKPLLGGDVEYVGEVGATEKLSLLASASCLLNPIAWPEPFGLVMIEALACGTPVVGTPLGASPEIVDDGITGFLRCDEQSLVDALAHVPDLDRAECRSAAETRFCATRMAADHVELFAALLAERRLQAA
jgi:glycosyltransferase involved in cell wall biosynthesis